MRNPIRSALITITAAMLLGSGAALAESNACKADLTGDGVVNFADLAVMKSVFFQSCPRFEDRGLTVFDQLTGLEWEKKDDSGGIHDKDNYYQLSTGTPWNPSGTAFTVFVAGLNAGPCYAGRCDWRLPTIDELKTIVDCSHGAPCVAPIFGLTQSFYYWSSSSFAGNPVAAWFVNFYDGLSGTDSKTYNHYVRAVRGGPEVPACGDGVAQGPTEECDDGNVVSGDGCSATCTIEPPLHGGNDLLGTGQTTCWDPADTTLPVSTIACAGTGQDAEIQAGATLAYVDNGDGTITDTNTGLMWEKLSDDGTIHDWDNTYTWANAFAVKIAALNSGGSGGHTDWRVPNRTELLSIVNLENFAPAVSIAFNTSCTPGCAATTCSCTHSRSVDNYWSSSSYKYNPADAWFVQFYDGSSPWGRKTNTHCVRAVRGGPEAPECGNGVAEPTEQCDDGNLVNGDGCSSTCQGEASLENRGLTVLDRGTGLEWEKKTDDGDIHDKDNSYTWSTGSPWDPNGTAFTVFLAGLNAGACYAGRCDWRLPTIDELKTIVDCSHGDPCVNAIFGPTQSFYFSSSSYAGVPSTVWAVSFSNGNSGNLSKTNPYYVRAVRGGL